MFGEIKNLKDIQIFFITNELQRIVILTNEPTIFDCRFPIVKKPFETYMGVLWDVKYFMKVTIFT